MTAESTLQGAAGGGGSDNMPGLPPSMDYTPGLVRMEDEESELKRKLSLFGKDVGSIPCFRNSFLYGISGGIGAGIVHFAVSSRVQKATKFGFWSYVGITFSYWCYCRYDYTMTKFRYTQLQYAMKESVLKEGTKDSLPRDMKDA